MDSNLVRFDVYILLKADCMRQCMNGVMAGALEPDPLIQVDIQDDRLVTKSSPGGTPICDALVKAIVPRIARTGFGRDDEAIA